MRITICHLSDIHFGKDGNTVLEKQEKMCNAILQNALKKDIILFIVSGDIAQTGQAKEYEIALNFFTEVQEYLERRKELRVLFFFVPGNHDCDFTDVQRNKDDDLRRDKVVSGRNDISEEDLSYYIDGLCQKQNNYYDFIELFEYDNLEKIQVKRISCSKLLLQYEILIGEKVIRLNLLNSAWLAEKREKPGCLYFPDKEYKKITKDGDIVITVYHHPSNWMHPNDRNEFNRWVMNKSDLVYVGHEHLGRNEAVKTRNTIYHAQYGEVLQERDDAKCSGFIISYIEDAEKTTHVYNWDNIREMYSISYTLSEKLNVKGDKYLYFQKEFQEYLETADIRISHPNKEKVTMRDLYVYPDIEAYKESDNNYDVNKDSITVKGASCIIQI